MDNVILVVYKTVIVSFLLLLINACGGSSATSNNNTPINQPPPAINDMAPDNLLGKDITLTVAADVNFPQGKFTRTYQNESEMFTRVVEGDFSASSASYALEKSSNKLIERATVQTLKGQPVDAYNRQTIYNFTTLNSGEWSEIVDNDVVLSGVFTLRNTPFQTNALGDSENVILIAGDERNYSVHLPPNFDAKDQSPLIFVFHGAGENNEKIRTYSQFNRISDKYRPVVIYGNSLGGVIVDNLLTKRWGKSGLIFAQYDNDTEYVQAVIDIALTEFNIDPDKVFLSGFSNGGSFIHHLMCEIPDRITGVALAAPAITLNDLVDCANTKAIPVIHTHGTDDRIVAYNGFLALSSVSNSLDYYAEKNRCEEEPMLTPLASIDDGNSTVSKLAYLFCDENFPVVHYRINEGGHNWPGALFNNGTGVQNTDIDWTELQWDFFRQL